MRRTGEILRKLERPPRAALHLTRSGLVGLGFIDSDRHVSFRVSPGLGFRVPCLTADTIIHVDLLFAPGVIICFCRKSIQLYEQAQFAVRDMWFRAFPVALLR